MAVAHVARHEVMPRRRDELVDIAGETDEVIERVGGRIELRRAMLAGEASDQITRVTLFPDPQSRATALDVLSQSPPPRMREMAASPDPPARLVSRSMLTEITLRQAEGRPAEGRRPDGLPERSRVISLYVLAPLPGRYDEVEAAIAEAQSLHESLGARVHVWMATMADAETGRIGYALGHDSFSAAAETMRRAREASAAAGRPGPLARLIRGGHCVGSSVSMLIEA